MTLADFCPYVQEFTWKSEDKTSRGTRCTDYSNQPSDDNNYALEEYGEGSMCFDQAGPWQQKSCAMLKQWQRYGAGICVTIISNSRFGHYFCSNLYGSAPRGPRGVKKSDFFFTNKTVEF